MDAIYNTSSVLDLRGQNVTSTLDLRDAFHQLHLCPTEDETQGESSTNDRRKYVLLSTSMPVHVPSDNQQTTEATQDESSFW